MDSLGQVETATKVVGRDIVIEKVEISEISFTSSPSYMTFEEDDYFLSPDATSWQTKVFTFSPPSICCGTCTVYGGDVQVYYWPTPAPNPPVSELVDSKGYVL
jgi:hypothetical protein